MNIKPLGENLIVKVFEAEPVSKGGIVLPDAAKEKPQEGEVIAVGSGHIVEGKRIPLEIKVGDKVIFSKYGGTEIKIEDEKYLVMRESDIYAIINK